MSEEANRPQSPRQLRRPHSGSISYNSEQILQHSHQQPNQPNYNSSLQQEEHEMTAAEVVVLLESPRARSSSMSGRHTRHRSGTGSNSKHLSVKVSNNNPSAQLPQPTLQQPQPLHHAPLNTTIPNSPTTQTDQKQRCSLKVFFDDSVRETRKNATPQITIPKVRVYSFSVTRTIDTAISKISEREGLGQSTFYELFDISKNHSLDSSQPFASYYQPNLTATSELSTISNNGSSEGGQQSQHSQKHKVLLRFIGGIVPSPPLNTSFSPPLPASSPSSASSPLMQPNPGGISISSRHSTTSSSSHKQLLLLQTQSHLQQQNSQAQSQQPQQQDNEAASISSLSISEKIPSFSVDSAVANSNTSIITGLLTPSPQLFIGIANTFSRARPLTPHQIIGGLNASSKAIHILGSSLVWIPNKHNNSSSSSKAIPALIIRESQSTITKKQQPKQLQKPSKIVTIWCHATGETLTTLGMIIRAHASVCKSDVIAFEYPGFGFYRGEPTIQAIMEDFLTIFNHTALMWPGIPIVLYGRGIGACFVLEFALLIASIDLAMFKLISGIVAEDIAIIQSELSSSIESYSHLIQCPVVLSTSSTDPSIVTFCRLNASRFSRGIAICNNTSSSPSSYLLSQSLSQSSRRESSEQGSSSIGPTFSEALGSIFDTTSSNSLLTATTTVAAAATTTASSSSLSQSPKLNTITLLANTQNTSISSTSNINITTSLRVLKRWLRIRGYDSMIADQMSLLGIRSISHISKLQPEDDCCKTLPLLLTLIQDARDGVHSLSVGWPTLKQTRLSPNFKPIRPSLRKKHLKDRAEIPKSWKIISRLTPTRGKKPTSTSGETLGRFWNTLRRRETNADVVQSLRTGAQKRGSLDDQDINTTHGRRRSNSGSGGNPLFVTHQNQQQQNNNNNNIEFSIPTVAIAAPVPIGGGGGRQRRNTVALTEEEQQIQTKAINKQPFSIAKLLGISPKQQKEKDHKTPTLPTTTNATTVIMPTIKVSSVRLDRTTLSTSTDFLPDFSIVSTSDDNCNGGIADNIVPTSARSHEDSDLALPVQRRQRRFTIAGRGELP